MAYNSKYTGAEVEELLDKANGLDVDGLATTFTFEDSEASVWVADSTYEDYPYRCDIPCDGVKATDYGEVVLDVAESTGGDYAPVCETKDGVVSLWSKVQASVTIPTIIIIR